MMRSLYSGVSGLRNHQTRMDVVGNNIANVNTVGYKAARTIFQDLYSQKTSNATAPGSTLGGTNPNQIGLGVSLASIDNLFTASAAQVTGETYDLMIQNDGFFVVRNGSNEYYTRAGNFYFDKSNYIVTSSGYYLMGFQAAITEGAEAVEAEASKLDSISYSTIYRTEDKKVINAKADINTKGVGPAFADLTFVLGAPDADGQPTIDSITMTSGTPPATLKDQYTVSLADNKLTITDKNNTRNSITIYVQDGVTATNLETKKVVFDPDGNLEDVTTGGTTGSIFLTAGLVDETQAYSVKEGSKTLTINDANGKISVDGYSVVYSDVLPAPASPTMTRLESGTGDSTQEQYITLTSLSNPNNVITINVSEYYQRGGLDKSNIKFMSTNNWTVDSTSKSLSQTNEYTYNYEIFTGGNPVMYTTVDLPGASPYAIFNFTDDPAKEVIEIAMLDENGTPTRLQVPRPRESNDYVIDVPSMGLYIQLNNNYQAGDLNGFSINMDGSGTKAIPMGEPISAFGTDPSNIGKIYVDPLLYNVSIDEQGVVSGLASRDGYITDPTTGKQIYVVQDQRVSIGQVVVSNFANQQALEKVGDNLYIKTANTGDVVYNQAGTNGAGKIKPGALEMSNVDLSAEFTDMIVTQRGFQANSRIITVSDTLLEELINLKR